MGLYILSFISIFSFSAMLQFFSSPVYNKIGNGLFGIYVFILIVTQLTKTKKRKPLQSLSSILFIERIGYQLGAHYFKEGVPLIKKIKSTLTTGFSRFASLFTTRFTTRAKFTFKFYQFLFKKINSLKFENTLLTVKYNNLEKDFNLMAQTWTPVKSAQNTNNNVNQNSDKMTCKTTALDTPKEIILDYISNLKSEKDQNYKPPQNVLPRN